MHPALALVLTQLSHCVRDLTETSRAILCYDVETWEKKQHKHLLQVLHFFFLIPKANHLEARDSGYYIVSWHKKQRYNNKKLDAHLHDY